MFKKIVQWYRWHMYKREINPVTKCLLGARLFRSGVESGVVACRYARLHNIHYVSYTHMAEDLTYLLNHYGQSRSFPRRLPLCSTLPFHIPANDWLLRGNSEVVTIWQARENLYNTFTTLYDILSDEKAEYINRKLFITCSNINVLTDLLGELKYEKTHTK
jgi:hypothetical protein